MLRFRLSQLGHDGQRVQGFDNRNWHRAGEGPHKSETPNAIFETRLFRIGQTIQP